MVINYVLLLSLLFSAPALTVENVMGALQGVSLGKDVGFLSDQWKWMDLGGCLGISRSKLVEVEQQYSSDEDRGRAVVEHWILADTLPSWRKLIWALNKIGETRVADAIQRYSEFLKGMLHCEVTCF